MGWDRLLREGLETTVRNTFFYSLFHCMLMMEEVGVRDFLRRMKVKRRRTMRTGHLHKDCLGPVPFGRVIVQVNKFYEGQEK